MNVKTKLVVISTIRIGSFEKYDILINFGKRTKSYEKRLVRGKVGNLSKCNSETDRGSMRFGDKPVLREVSEVMGVESITTLGDGTRRL